MNGGLVITSTTGTIRPRIRVDGCPRCRRPLHLDHAGTLRDGEPIPDIAEVLFAQQLHVATCAG